MGSFGVAEGVSAAFRSGATRCAGNRSNVKKKPRSVAGGAELDCREESRRNAGQFYRHPGFGNGGSLREIDRRRTVLGGALPRAVQEVEDAEFKVIERRQLKGKDAA